MCSDAQWLWQNLPQLMNNRKTARQGPRGSQNADDGVRHPAGLAEGAFQFRSPHLLDTE
jgi:hypothetical protein